MRELTLEELEYISGGTDPDVEDIVVTASPPPSPSYYPPPGGYYPPSSPPPYGGGGGGGGTEYAQWQAWAGGAALDFLANFFSDKAVSATERETKMADKFNPTEVVANIQGMDKNGNIDKGWQMRDGSAFFDTNGNGTPDLQMWTDPAGNVWSDEGSGKTQVRGAG